jgi:murein L,D-transpeptidase YcbB/YkuD
MIRNVLKSSLGSGTCERLKEAALVPFRALQMGIDSNTDDSSVTNVEVNLITMARAFTSLPAKHLPLQKSTNEPPRAWGPFEFTTNPFDDGNFNEQTFHSVRRFQEQAGLKVDGKAGIKTLRRLDEIVKFMDDNFIA